MPAPKRRRSQRLWRDPLTIAEADIDMTPFIPDVVEFTVSDRYLNKPFLYPRQATLLKLIFLQLDQLTQYDYDVIGEWGEGFTKFEPDPDARLRGEQSKWQGTNGIQPDVLDRAEYLRANGYHWFREVVSIIGRRGSKGHIGGIAGAYVLWYYIQLGNPQRHYGVDPAKKLAAFVFGGKKEQAKANQWADFTSCISWSNCFTPFVSNSLGEIMTIFAKSDFATMEEMETKGIPIGPDPATFLIEPKESTPISARGPASFCLHFDEMAHVVKGVAKAEAKTVYEQAKPSLDQFGKDAFLYEGSSTWQMTGQFYENYQQATLLKPDGLPARPEMIMWQLTSWDPYVDWERAKDLKLTATSDRKFFPLQGAVSAFDEQMEREQQANAETFAVERLSHWQASLNVYLRADKVDEAFGSWGGREIVMQSKGLLGRTYRAHGDPSKTNANFGFAIAHTEGPDENGLMHVVFDVVHAWMPRDYPNGIVLYVGPGSIEEAIWQYTQDFMPGELTFDQFNSLSTIQSLQQRIGKAALPKGIQVYERTANKALNWTTYETFKAALNMNLVHIPQYELAQQELTFLEDKGGVVDHPSAGPVQTKDVADCYDDSMEVLTERGWMSFADVPTGIKVATRSAGGVLEYQEPTDYIARHHQGVMYEYDSHRLNFSVTPRHRMLVQRDGGVEFIEAQHLAASQYRIPKTSMVEGRTPNTICFDTDDLSAARKRVGGRGGSRVGSGWTAEQDEYLRQHYSTASMTDLCAVLGKTRGAIYNRAKPKHLNLQRGQIGDRIGDRPDPLPETKVEDFAAFLGIWLAEGRKVRDKRGYAVKITQTKPEAVEWIDNLFDRLSWPVRRTVQANGETVWTVKSYGLREYLRACQGEGHELRIPDEVFTTWTRQEMGALLEGLLVGDGCWSKQAGRHVGYYSTSKRLVDDVQRLLLHLGYSTGAAKVVRRVSQYRANHDLWYVGVNTSQHSTLYIDRLKQVPYDGMVYCLTVPNSTLLVRRNGVPMWSGNCIAIVTHALLGDQMAQYIGKALGDLPLSGSASGGFDPYAHQADNSFQTVQEQFAQFARGAAMSRAMGAPRRRR